MLDRGIFGKLYHLVCIQELPWLLRLILSIGSSLDSQFKKAVVMCVKHRTAFDKFSATFSETTVKEFERRVAAWDADNTQPNPYEEPIAGMPLSCNRRICVFMLCLGTTTADVKLELAREEAADAARGVVRAHDVSISAFLTQALDIEEQQ